MLSNRWLQGHQQEGGPPPGRPLCASPGWGAPLARRLAGAGVVVMSRSDSAYSGWNTAMVFPSGSLNQAERPIPGEVTM